VTRTCVHSQVGISVVDPVGRLWPCCKYTLDKTNPLPTIFDVDTLDKLHNTSPFKKIRYDIENKIDSIACSMCWIKESTNQESRRTATQNLYQKTKTKINPGYIQDMEIALDYTCNMMCRSCGTDASSKWMSAKSVLDSFEKHEVPSHGVVYNKSPKQFAEQFKKVIINTNFSKMRQVKVLGGEPFYSKNIDWFIEKLYNEVEDREALDLNIFTNASVWPKDETLKRLLKFPRVSITLSLDAINDLANVIRWGVRWDQIYPIVLKWKQTPIHLHINNTISIQNVNHAKDFLQFANNNNINVSFNFLDRPNYLSVYQFPLKERKKWILQGDSKTEKLFNSSLLADIQTQNEFNSFLKSLDILDSYQKCSFKNVNNEIYELARKYSDEKA
tara:strand:+ start:94 stop:1257 length:1164 start_codon:yes stop_codon:yes gene_type:complete